MNNSETLLKSIFDAERNLRAAEAELLASSETGELIATLQQAVKEAAAITDLHEAGLRLERLSDLCAQVQGPDMADALIAILNHEALQVRVAAGEALRDVGYERYAEVAHAVDRALDRGDDGAAMTELPWVLAEIGEPSALPLIRRFLEHSSAEVVASAVESLLQLGDPDAIGPLQALVSDTRAVAIMDEGDAETATLGELASEAIRLLGGAAER